MHNAATQKSGTPAPATASVAATTTPSAPTKKTLVPAATPPSVAIL
jgi:hypothetical protein